MWTSLRRQEDPHDLCLRFFGGKGIYLTLCKNFLLHEHKYIYIRCILPSLPIQDLAINKPWKSSPEQSKIFSSPSTFNLLHFINNPTFILSNKDRVLLTSLSTNHKITWGLKVKNGQRLEFWAPNFPTEKHKQPQYTRKIS